MFSTHSNLIKTIDVSNTTLRTNLTIPFFFFLSLSLAFLVCHKFVSATNFMYDDGFALFFFFVWRLFISDKMFTGMTTLQNNISSSINIQGPFLSVDIYESVYVCVYVLGWFMLCVPNELFCFWLFLFLICQLSTKIFIMSILLHLILPYFPSIYDVNFQQWLYIMFCYHAWEIFFFFVSAYVYYRRSECWTSV